MGVYMRTKFWIFAALSAILLFPVSAWAAGSAPSSNDPARLDEVLVEAPAIYRPLNAATLISDDLVTGSAASGDTASLLGAIPGVNIYQAGGISGLPAVRGLADDRLRIKVDGKDIVASCPNHMNPALSYVDPSSLDQVRVYAGVSPVSVGGDSIGGAILVESPEPLFSGEDEGTLFRGRTQFMYRTNGDMMRGNLSATAASEDISVRYSGGAAASDNYDAAKDFKSTPRTGNDGRTLNLDVVGSSAYEAQDHAVNVAWKNDRGILEAGMKFQDIPYQNYPNQRMDMLGNTEYRPSIDYSADLDWGRLEAGFFYQKVEHHMNFGDDKRFWYGALSGVNGTPCSPMSATCAEGMPMYTEGDTYGLSVQAEIELSESDLLRVGHETHIYRLDDWWPASGGMMWPNTFININDGERDRTAFFGEWERRLSERWTALAGVRYELVRMDAGEVTGYNAAGMGNQGRDANLFNAADRARQDNNWDATVLSTWEVTDSLDVELGYAHKTRSPNLYERYAWSTWSMPAVMVNWFGDGNGYVGNIDLEPEKADTVSLTADLHSADRKWQLRAAPHYTRVRDHIDAVQWNATTNAAATTLARDQFSVLKFVNQSAELYGVDVSGRMPLAETTLGTFGLEGLFSWLEGENRDTDDDLYNIMPVNGSLTLTQAHGGWRNDIETVWVDAKEDVSDMRNEIRTKRYGLFHYRGSYSWERYRIDFGVENLLDKRYSHPLGGAYVGQGSTMTMNPTDGIQTWGTAVPGPGRLFYAGVTIEF